MTRGRLRALASLLLGGLLVAAQVPALARAAADPKVVLVVGPVGGLTETYRDFARAGAAEARRWTDAVVEVYSPDATWPRVRAALRGASVVVYMGHGNGFPSPYGSTLRPAVQNGFGLNPVAGRGDVAHQYFGEGPIAAQVDLAPGAVVLLFHLCYASGLAEPGVPEGSPAVARQRIDNFAAGFLAAGAGAVAADAYGAPAPYLRALLGSRSSARSAWQRSATANDNVVAFPSQRTPGAVAYMDPEESDGGFSRSLVVAAGTAGSIPTAPGGGGSVPPGGWEIVLPPEPTTAPDAFDLGARPGTPALDGMPLAGTTVDLRLPVTLPAGVALDGGYRLGTRWIPLDEPAVAADGDATPEASPGPTPSTGPPWAAPAASPSAGPSASPGAAPTPPAASTADLVARESAASLVDVVPATVAGVAVTGRVGLPATTGRYRLEVTIHDRDGVALAHSVQATIPAVVVHVGGPGAAWIDVPQILAARAGTIASVRAVVTNGEADAWGRCAVVPLRPDPDGAACPTVRVVGRWIAVAGGEPPAPTRQVVRVGAASVDTVWLNVSMPREPGTYLLVVSLEREVDGGRPAVLGRPATVTVTVEVAPLLPTPAGD